MFSREPYILRLYNWNKMGVIAYCSKKQFNKVFAGYNVIYDVDKDKVYAPYIVGNETIMVIRDDSK